MLGVDLVTTRNDWAAVLRQMGNYDYCHSFDFHHISSKNGEGEPIMFAVKNAACQYVFCWPALRRSIPDTPWCDITSVYGYGGPLFVGAGSVRSCLSRVLDCMRDLGVISVFSRMHPLFVEQLPDDPAVRGEVLGNVVIIDTRNQDPVTSYRSDHRRGIRRAWRAGVTTEIDIDGKRFDEFLSLYSEAMKALEADAYYHFDRKYFRLLRDATDFQTVLTFATYDGRAIGAGLSLITNRIMQAYLGGSLPAYRHMAPMKVITATEHQFASDHGLDSLILGGGVGLADDQLLQFKRGFSHDLKTFNIYKNILNLDVYEELCNDVGVAPNVDDYFPAYRFSSKINAIEEE